MKLRPLVVDDTLKAEIARMMEYACEHPIDNATLLLISRGELLPARRDLKFSQKELDAAPTNAPGYRYVDPFGYSMVFSVEEQPCGWCRHLSLAVDEAGKLPSEVACAMLLALFGFRTGVKGAFGFIENGRAINFVEPLRDDEDPKALHLARPWESKPPKFDT